MSNSRSAEATIKGFNYQFAATILFILNAGNNDQITVEGIEDVDVIGANRFDAVQCKYYEGTKLTNSVLREIVEPMLKDFAGRQTKITYHIYGHFKDMVNFPLADANQFKSDVLSYRQGSGNNLVIGNLADDLALDNAALATFLQRLKFKYTSDYESHRSEVIQALRATLGCSQIDAEFFFYPNAFSLVADLGTKSTDAERTIRRSVFLSRINSKQIVFKQWLLDEKSEAQFCRAMRIQFFSPANTSPFARFFVIECDGTETVHTLKSIALEIRKKGAVTRNQNDQPLLTAMRHTFCFVILLPQH